MARLRRTSHVLESARQRLGRTALTLAAHETQITGFGGRLENYNQQVAALDDLQNGLEADEDSLTDMNKRMLSAVEAHYGPNSSQYEAARGTRTSERKKPTRNSGGTTPPPGP